MKRGAWVFAACLVSATMALSFGLAEDEAPRTSRSNPRYFPRGGGNDSGESQLKADAPKSSRAFKLRSATVVPAGGVPSESATAQHPFPAKGNQHAHYERESKEKGRVQQVSGSSNPFPKKGSGKSDASGPPLPPLPTPAAPKHPVPPVRQAGFSKPELTKPNLSAGPQTPMVTVQWIKQGDINVGQECEVHLVVKNTGTIDARHVLVEATLPSSVRIVTATPAPADAKERVLWTFLSLPAGEQKTIVLKLIPTQRGALTTTAAVRFTGLAATQFSVKEPLIKVAMAGPTKVMVGESAAQIVEVTNPGSGTARNVSIEAWIPAGLEHPRGKRLAMDIGALAPGETRKVRLSLTAKAGGDQKIRVKAASESSLVQEMERVVKVESPSLKVAMDGPGLRYVGRNAIYTIKVTNDGTVATNNVRVLHKLPEGFRFLRADRGGSYSAKNSTIAWFVGRIDPGKSIEVRAALTATELGTGVHQAGAISEQGAKAQTQFKTAVDGTASLDVEIHNPDDPIEVGAATIYEIRVRNAGTKADSNVKIACELPAGVTLLGAKGPTRAAESNGTVLFAPLSSLPAGKTAVYRVQVRGTKAGNIRLRARLTSDSVKNGLTYDKLTKFYAD